MARRKCKSCTCKCILLSLNCFAASSIVSVDIGADTIISEMDKAQRLYLKPILGKICLDSLCEALDNSERPDSDPLYMPLSSEYEELLRQLEPALVAATEFSYYERFGFSKLTGSGAKFNENWILAYYKAQLKTLDTLMSTELSLLEDWVKDNCDTIDCYDCADVNPCEPEESISLQWGTTSPYSEY